MMNYTGTELLWLFLIYSFAGWVIETVFTTVKHRKFANRGLINGPFCILYGITAVLITVGLGELTGFWLFLFSCIFATAVEWNSGHLIERIFKERWWNYSNVKWNLDGYICLPASLLWGGLGLVIVKWVNGFIVRILQFLPAIMTNVLLITLLVILAVDAIASYLLLKQKGKHLEQWENANNKIDHVSVKLRYMITGYIDRRIHKAYPLAKKIESEVIKDEGVFAQGCGFYKIWLLFIVGGFLGDIVETIFCRITAGIWMSRSSVVWGPFSIVWGLAIAVVTAMLYKYKDRSDRFLFFVGTFLGGAYEYLCSVFTEIVFGKVFWDYSKIPFNLGGRINLLYCFFWGFAAVIWFKLIYPVISDMIEKIPVIIGKVLTWMLIIFMCCNILVSVSALIRYDERSKNIQAEDGWQSWVDTHYDDSRMAQIYPNAVAR
ncbi:MAG: hypothetical protein EOM34_00445 [Clostridia bacterium]|nr:putative ABC transporter permease [Lachnospiraceae bacterium]NCB99134.1 hypothetical protein [Clostridia bacterium]NCD02190.1 hypothetical protein [Clostridia bacterium]